MRRGTRMALLLLGACGAPAPVETPAPAVSSASRPPVTVPRVTYHRDGFRDPDALPDGAFRRYGSRALHGGSRLALLDNGWLVEGQRMWRADGRVVEWTEQRFLGRRGDDLAVFENDTVHWLGPDGSSLGEVKPDCEHNIPWLTSDGGHLLCRVEAPSAGGEHRSRVIDADTSQTHCELPVEVHGPDSDGTAVVDVLVTEQNHDGEWSLVAYDLGTCKPRWRRPQKRARALRLAPDTSRLFVIDEHGHLAVHATKTGEPQWRLALPPWQFDPPLRVSSDGRHVAFSMRRDRRDAPSLGRVGLLDLATRTVAIVAERSPAQLDFSPTGSELAMDVDGELVVVDVASGKTLYRPSLPRRGLAGASVYGELVVSVSDGGWLQTWDRETGKTRLDRQIADEVQQVLFLPPPRVAILNDWPQTYRVLDVTTGEEQCIHKAEAAVAPLRWPGGEVALVEDSVRIVDGHFVSRVTAVGTDCEVIAQHDLDGRIVEAELTPKHVVELVLSNGTERDEPSHMWLVRWPEPHQNPTEVPGTRKSVDEWESPTHAHTPVDDDTHYLLRADGSHLSVGDEVVVNAASPVALVSDDTYRISGPEAFVFERASGRLRSKVNLPPHVSFSDLEVDDTGRWLTAIDDASVVVYALEPHFK